MLQDSANIKPKKRHGCLTTWLVLIIVFNAVAIIVVIPKGSPGVVDLPWPQVLIAIVLSLCNVGFAIGLFMWKKWAFWGFCASALASLIINIVMGQLLILAIVSFVVELGILLFVLNVGRENKGWPQLE